MIIYQETKQQFINDVYSDEIEVKIQSLMLEKLNRRVAQGEYRSWINSLQYMYKVLLDERIPLESTISIEYNIPHSNKRIDFIVSGEDNNGKENAIIVELKQWDSIEKVEGDDSTVKTYLNGRLTEVNHPSYQAWSYSEFLKEYNEDIKNYKIFLRPCACLHNYRKQDFDDIVDLTYQYFIDKAPIFTRGEANQFSDYIAKYIKKENQDVMLHIENGKIKPSKAIQESLVKMLEGKEEFILLDDQRVAFQQTLRLINNQSSKKQVHIIHGGPGTGKTVIAIHLLVKLINKDLNTIYVTKNVAPREVYKKKLSSGGYRKVYIDNLFRSSGTFTNAQKDDYDCIITDESHRLNAKSGMYQNQGENQIKEIINASKVSVFFVDDHQIVTTSDIGSSDEIKKWCQHYNADVYENKLTSQFRCNGSNAYLSWVDSVLEIEKDIIESINIDYDIQIFDDPNDLKNAIYEKNKVNNKSRIVAGYCWEWKKENRNKSYMSDIIINNFHMPWNFEKTKTWSIDEESVEQVGCIHTCQGLEFDYIGVIIGDDLRYENDKVVTDFFKRASSDRSIRGLKTQYKNDKEEALSIADTIIKNTYRTLLTRGQKGCYIYCTDKSLSKYLKQRLERGKRNNG